MAILRRTAGMGRLPGESHTPFGGCQKTGLCAGQRRPFFFGRINVHSQHHIHVIHNAAFHHGKSAFDAFFCRLKDHFDLSVQQLPVFLQDSGQHHAHGGVSVVAAGMHAARIL